MIRKCHIIQNSEIWNYRACCWHLRHWSECWNLRTSNCQVNARVEIRMFKFDYKGENQSRCICKMSHSSKFWSLSGKVNKKFFWNKWIVKNRNQRNFQNLSEAVKQSKCWNLGTKLGINQNVGISLQNFQVDEMLKSTECWYLRTKLGNDKNVEIWVKK